MIQKVQNLKNTDKVIHEKLNNTFSDKNYPCLYGKMSFNKNLMYAATYKNFDKNSISLLADDLRIMSKKLDHQKANEEKILNTFIAVFDIDDSNIPFDKFWYETISLLHSFDKKEWKEDATKDLSNPEFKLSFDDKLWFPVLMTPNHPNKIRKAKITILSFQPDQTFKLNKTIDNEFYENMRKKIHKKIDKIYENDRPHYLSEKSTGKGMVQFLGYDFEEDKNFLYPKIIK